MFQIDGVHSALKQRKFQLFVLSCGFQALHGIVIPEVIKSHARACQSGRQSEGVVSAPEKSIVDLLAHSVEQGNVRIQVFACAVSLHRLYSGGVGTVHLGKESGYGHVVGIHHHGNVIHKG